MPHHDLVIADATVRHDPTSRGREVPRSHEVRELWLGPSGRPGTAEERGATGDEPPATVPEDQTAAGDDSAERA